MLSAWVLRFRKGYLCINLGEKINKISCRACTQEMISMTFRGKRKGVPFSSMKNQIKHYSNILQKKDMMSHFEFIQKIKQESKILPESKLIPICAQNHYQQLKSQINAYLLRSKNIAGFGGPFTHLSETGIRAFYRGIRYLNTYTIGLHSCRLTTFQNLYFSFFLILMLTLLAFTFRSKFEY